MSEVESIDQDSFSEDDDKIDFKEMNLRVNIINSSLESSDPKVGQRQCDKPNNIYQSNCEDLDSKRNF